MFKNLVITCFLGLVAIILGAFGAHSLKDVLSSVKLLSFETAVRYQMYHVIVLLFVNTYEGFSLPQKNKISSLFFWRNSTFFRIYICTSIDNNHRKIYLVYYSVGRALFNNRLGAANYGIFKEVISEIIKQ